MKEFFKNNLWGISLSLLIAVISLYLGPFLQLGAVITALGIGVILGNLGWGETPLRPGVRFTEKYILEAAIVLLGFSLSFRYLKDFGLGLWLLIGLSVVLVMLVAFLLARATGLSGKMGLLLGAGSAICGTAAIASISPLIKSNEDETGLSIAVINLLGTLGLVFLPASLAIMEYNEQSSALMLGGVLQSVGHVTGAAFSMGDEIGRLALVYKMGRILWLIPLILAIFFSGNMRRVERVKVKFPLFIVFFLVAVTLAQFKAIPEFWKNGLTGAGNFLLITAMAAIGYKIKLRPLFMLARPALVSGVGIFVFQILIFWLLIYLR